MLLLYVMKPEFQLIPEKREKSFIAVRLPRKRRLQLRQVWHYHPEIEICFTLQGRGRRFVGNDVTNYEQGDLLMLGSNLPHGFMTSGECIQVVILFGQDFLGDNFFDKPELTKVKSLISRAQNGLNFTGETKRKAKKIIRKILQKEGLQKTILFLELLDLLSRARDVEMICNETYHKDLKMVHLNRIKLVYNHITEHFREEIRVKDLAELVNLTEAAFFKFIKRHTDKTFVQMINEYRINHASKQLMTTDKSIAEICYDSGYNNISYFNRKFLEVMRITPSKFRSLYAANTRQSA